MIYLIRHGIAANRAEYQEDKLRPLTDKGRQRTKKVAQRLCKIGLKLDLILTSPLVRARQTAEILQQVGLSARVEEFLPLAPEGDLQDWVNWWLKYPKQDGEIALVGHQPDLGNWAESLVWGETKSHLVLKKAGIIGLTLPSTGTPIANSELFLLTSPKWLLY